MWRSVWVTLLFTQALGTNNFHLYADLSRTQLSVAHMRCKTFVDMIEIASLLRAVCDVCVYSISLNVHALHKSVHCNVRVGTFSSSILRLMYLDVPTKYIVLRNMLFYRSLMQKRGTSPACDYRIMPSSTFLSAQIWYRRLAAVKKCVVQFSCTEPYVYQQLLIQSELQNLAKININTTGRFAHSQH